jgi:3-hydroxyisobutyrate dehydrogenase-like beta-hydroxyacid dehydrogenase
LTSIRLSTRKKARTSNNCSQEIGIMPDAASTPTVALMSPGDMGHSVGALLKRQGVRVITALDGRSRRTADLARAAGIEPVASDVDMIRSADLLLSIVAPAGAEALADRLAKAIPAARSDITYVDCNAVAPSTAARIAAVIEAAGGRFVDAGIVGPPPREDSRATRFYASGAHAGSLAALNDFGLDVRVIGERIGDASALKMCYAALNKGTIALMTGISVMAERLGVEAPLDQELQLSQDAVRRRMHSQVPGMVPKAHRWIGEMEEIAKTFSEADLTPAIFEGIADIYRLVAEHPLAAASPETWREAALSYHEIVTALSADRD